MPIWKLEPTDPTEDHWRCSKWIGTLFIRAKDEFAARGIAQDAFGIVAEKLPGLDPQLAWPHDWISTCEQVEDSEYDAEGPDDILGPEEALNRAHPRPW